MRSILSRCHPLMLLFVSVLSACPAGGGGDAFLPPPGLTSGGTTTCPADAWPFDTGAYLADFVTEAPGETGGTFGNSLCAVNGVYGNGLNRGSGDVYSLKSSPASTMCEANEKCIVLEWAGRRVLSGAGVDFVVFENPFNRTSGGRFIEAVIVEVSENGTAWCGWNPAYTGETDSSVAQFSLDIYDVTKYDDVAGLEPVLFNQSTWTGTAADVFDVAKAGGDHFDLADLVASGSCDAGTVSAIQASGFVYLRMTTANSRSPAAFPLPGDSFDQTADIDGVVARNVADR
ncbi:MAG: LIC_13355 family lipoprotein [Leptonema illini]|uniref:LIC_13355 family lipoprotein n=1 Tax=Leptonema illini TaxID=183 RepID=A0A833LXY0_9LEPT|nr:MAG: LIC_13355 family lipoprotein [Leptonema illini]